jgi:cell wall-associated NlpC family hydrolase
MTTRAAIIAEARSWLGTPYHHKARIKGVGVDCAMILIGIFAGVGLIDEFEPEDYPRDWMLHREEDRFRDYVRQYAEQIDSAEIQPGDVALYKVGKCFAHGAVIIGWPLVLHADSRSGKVTLAEGDQGWLSGRAVEFYRVRGIQ